MEPCREVLIMNQFRFNVTTPEETFVAAPINSEIKWNWELEDGFPVMNLGTKLVFQDSTQNDSLDFSKLYTLERSKRRCEKIFLTVDGFDKGVQFNFFDGYFRVTNCDWNPDLKRTTVDVQSLNPYTCITEKWGERLNLIDYGTAERIDAYRGVRTLETCRKTFYANQRLSPRIPAQAVNLIADDCPFAGFSEMFSNTIKITEYDNSGEPKGVNYGARDGTVPTARPRDTPVGTPGLTWPVRISDTVFNGPEVYAWKYEIETVWAFDFVASGPEPAGNGWVAYNGGWARPSVTYTYLNDDGEKVTEVMFEYGIEGAYSFNDIIENIITEFCGEALISNFYGINSDGSNPNNKYYDRAAEGSEMKELFIVPKSEIINYNEEGREGQRATNIYDKRKEKGYTFKSMLEDIRILHAVELRYINGTFYLEHESYFKRTYRIDLTKERYAEMIKGNWDYSYFTPKMPDKEQWRFMDVTDDFGDFDYGLIKYENCLSEGTEEENYTATGVTNNIEALYIDGLKEDRKFDLDGISIVSTFENTINISPGEFSGRFRLNEQQSLPYLIRNYHTFKRPKVEGVWIKDEILHFDNPYEIREIENTICIPLSDIQTINVEDYAKTQLNWGIIDKAELTCPANHLKLTTHHK